jgi:hypothetical protein
LPCTPHHPQDAARTQLWHPDVERFTGRSGNETWPGFGNRPPLVIEGELAYCYFHSGQCV